MFDNVKTGRKLAELRKVQGLTQDDVAGRLNISPQAVSKWENGRAMPELSLLVELAQLLGSSLDGLLFPDPQPAAGANFEQVLLPYAPIAEFSGRTWPRSMAYPALLSAVKLFMGLEEHRDQMGRQINGDAEYVLQAAFTYIGFGYSWGRDDALETGLRACGLSGELHGSEDCAREELISLAVRNILSGYPVVIIPREYSDVILATGFSDRGRVLKGLAFLDGDDEKNSVMSFGQLKSFEGWYHKDFDMLLIRPGTEPAPIGDRCREALRDGLRLLGNLENVFSQPMEGYGLVIYDNWCRELQRESNQELAEIECLSPHIFIHYESKLRIKEFLELCMRLIDGIDIRPMLAASSKYGEIIDLCEKCMENLTENPPENADGAKKKRKTLIAVLQRSRGLETEALEEIAAAIQ